MPDVCANYSSSSEGGEVVRFFREVTFKLTLKRCVKGNSSQSRIFGSQRTFWGFPRPSQGGCKAINSYIIMQRHYLPVPLCL